MYEMYLEMIRLFFIVGGFVALIIGILLFVKPDLIAQMSKSGNKWYSGRKSTKPLDIIRETDSFYFSHHVIIGTTMVILSIIGLYLVLTRIPTSDQIMAFSDDQAAGVTIGILLESLKWFLLVTIILGIPMWITLAVKPELVRNINGKMNKWVSTRMLLLPLEKMNNGFDVFVLHYNRFFGALFILGAVFILFKFLW